MDRQGRVTLINEAAQRLLGWCEEDLMGTRLHDRLHACHPDEVCDLRVASWADTEHFGGEYLFHRGDTDLQTPKEQCARVSYMTAPLIVDGRVEGAVLVFHPVPAHIGSGGRGEDRSPRASLAHVTALVLANAPGPDEALGELLPALCEADGWDIATYWTLDLRRQMLRWHAGWHRSGIEMGRFDSMCRQISFERGVDFPGRAWQEGKTVWVHDLRTEADVLRLLVHCAMGCDRGSASR